VAPWAGPRRAADGERATALNSQVVIDGESPDDVAAEFLVEAGIISG
jgi:glycine betaine/choline ABC-type transport system substrate-binding protein